MHLVMIILSPYETEIKNCNNQPYAAAVLL